MDPVRSEGGQHRKPGAKPNSIPFTVPENRLLSELYLSNRVQYHAKSRVVVGEKNGETSQERFASQFAAELTKLGFAHRTSAQVKQRIADIRKLGHKLIHKEGSEHSKKKKKVFVEPWLRSVMDVLEVEAQEAEGPRKRIQAMGDVDSMSAMAQNVLNSHLESQGEPSRKKRRSARNMSNLEKAESAVAKSKSPSADPPQESPGQDDDLDTTSSSALNTPSHGQDQGLLKELENGTFSFSDLQHKLVEVQLRVALKTERLLDLKIKKMQMEMNLAATRLRQSSFGFPAEEEESSGEEEPADEAAWKTENGGATAEIQEKNTADLIECLLTLKGNR